MRVHLPLLSLLSLAHSLPHSIPTWQTLAPIPIASRQEHTTLFLPPSTIAILGGVVPDNTSNLIPPFANTPLMQFYSMSTNTWTSRAPLPVPMNHINAATANGKIYLLGGLIEYNNDLGRSWRAIPDCWVYDADTDCWTALPQPLPASEARGSAAVGVYDDKIYLAGGVLDLQFYGNATQNSVSVVSVFDIKTETWLDVPEKAKSIPAPRDHAGAAVVGDKMYVLGGRDHGQGNVRDTVFVLDLCDLDKGWEVSEARMPTPRGGVAAGVVGTKVYTFGGEGDTSVESGVFDEIEAYDTVNDSWESVGTMNIPRHGTYAVGVEGKVYIPGGAIVQGGGPVTHFDVFVP
ncbi:hypothetical protein DE146DRAFT_388191 [Phaeosphaeria sp. MPI-PUGE-AT-0046c]|nr:hypothetical protein DE146DRAFT_388191 [Phaeosphaeria sp. MPI-PUGE-AT-0046c]